MLSVTKIMEFEAAHFLPDHPGKCKNLHGHTYKIEITIGRENDEPDENGMILDFGNLKRLMEEHIITEYDHKLLNECFKTLPTAENMVLYIKERMEEMLFGEQEELIRVRLWETSTSYAEWRKE